MQLIHLALSVSATLACYCLWKYRAGKRRLLYPPGPAPWPLLGNLPSMPTSLQWLAYEKLSVDYGDVVHLSALGRHIVVLNSAEAVSNLLEKRASIYSDRLESPMFDEIDMNWNFGFIRYGSKWRAHRRSLHQHFNAQSVGQYQDAQVEEFYKFLQLVLAKPEDFRDHIRLFAGSLILRVAYGIPVNGLHDPYLLIEEALAEGLIQVAIHGTFLGGLLPILKRLPSWFPGSGFAAKTVEWREAGRRAVEEPYAAGKANSSTTHGQSSFIGLSLSRLADHERTPNASEEEAIIKGTAGSIFAAGVDTITNSLSFFIATMALNPAVQRKAQAELDAVLSPGSPATLADRPNLPYIEATLREVLRCQYGLPLGIPHCATEDDTYQGYHIPRGTIIMGNSWMILHDPRVYPEPYTFRPERFLKNDQLDSTVPFPDAVFGYARRKCPGRHFASNTLFLSFANLLSFFNIEQALDAAGNSIPINLSEINDGPAPSLKPFRCSIKQRHINVPQDIQRILERFASL